MVLLKHPAWAQTVLIPENLSHPRQGQGLRREVNEWLQPALAARDYAGAWTRLRQFREREMLRMIRQRTRLVAAMVRPLS